MTKAELIAVARKCAERNCYNCPILKPSGKCVADLLNALADELEKTRLIIPVGAGENYEVRNDG